MQRSKVHIFRDDQQIKDQHSAHEFRRDKCVNLPSCPAKRHFVVLRGRIRFSRSRYVCVCAVINCCPPKRTEQGPVQGSRQGSHEGLCWKQPLVLSGAGWGCFSPWLVTQGRLISHGTSAAVRSLAAQHRACTQNPARASSTTVLKAQGKVYTGETGLSLLGCQKRLFSWKCFGKRTCCRAPGGR